MSLNASAVQIRTFDGAGNNTNYASFGQAGTPLTRLLEPAYADSQSSPRGGDPTSLPSARAISNSVASQPLSKPSSSGLTSWIWQWGQFLDHDIDLTGAASPHESFNIQVPAGDPYFDPFATGTQEIGLERSIYTVDNQGVRQQLNQISAYIDGSGVYGSDSIRADYLRTLDGSGKMKTGTADNGEILLPYNLANLDNAMQGPDASAFFIAGDVRANEQLGLTAVHTLFVREHNRLADQLSDRLAPSNADPADPLLAILRDQAIATADNGIDNQGDFIYYAARKVVGAQIQKITYNEFVPVLLGNDALDAYSAYDESINPGISNAFSTAAYRVGHTMLPSQLMRSHDLDAANATATPLKDAFFNPADIQTNGIDSLLLGLMVQPAEEIDSFIIDDVRNFLFGPPGAGGFDLAALNIQRGRDHGLPGYNQARLELGLTARESFLDMTDGDQLLAEAFSSLYSSIDEVDLWAGGLAEAHYNGGLVGETFAYIIKDQFTRTRDGDRFFFMNPDEMTELLLIDPLFMRDTSLGNIIERNIAYVGMPDNMFVTAYVATPGSLLLILAGLGGLLVTRIRS
ncbi:peroxidase family protein [Nitrococcus mobilis]|uniref:Peroxinectin n=1 Tax=Nitrococcus mobilis Nb-231 TaxID=314278 RepID=A4BN96_9GAMM|nr:peroxidase family protein [Nitrococcus mobilis]EAR22695.1 peroxinectin precursor [Nitrococcus mobilis Nb-231]